jgi:hypothetical protein
MAVAVATAMRCPGARGELPLAASSPALSWWRDLPRSSSPARGSDRLRARTLGGRGGKHPSELSGGGAAARMAPTSGRAGAGNGGR